jgi:hypothetical protein
LLVVQFPFPGFSGNFRGGSVILKRESLGLQEAEFKNLSQILQKRFKEKGYGKKSWIVSERSVTGGVEKNEGSRILTRVLKTQGGRLCTYMKGSAKGNKGSSGMFWGTLHLVSFATGSVIGKFAQVHGLRKTVLCPIARSTYYRWKKWCSPGNPDTLKPRERG